MSHTQQNNPILIRHIHYHIRHLIVKSNCETKILKSFDLFDQISFSRITEIQTLKLSQKRGANSSITAF